MSQTAPMSFGDQAPFRLSSLSQHAFTHAGWIRVERQALLSVANRERLLLLGQTGTGKSLLLRSIERSLTRRNVSVHRFSSADHFEDLNSQEVLLIDEASALSAAEYKRISQLRNAVIMCGLPSLPERLSDDLEAFQSVTLEPLAPEEVARFVIARLLESGRPRTMFTPEALVAIARQSNGLMRLVIILAGAALFFAEQRGAEQVSVDDVAEAVSMRSVISEELEQSDAPDMPVRYEHPAPRTIEARPAWRIPAALRGWHWNRIGGTSAFVCASLAVIGASVMLARQIDALPSLASQDVRDHSMTRMASATIPDLAASPAGAPIPAPPVQLAISSPPPHADPTSSPAVVPSPSPIAGSAEAPTAGSEGSGADLVDRSLSARPPTPPSRAEGLEKTVAFTGPILNETMGQGGQLSLQLRPRGGHGLVDAVFHASKGLIGSGVLTGDIDDDGHITLSGRLMMGQNPFDCALEGTLKGDRFVGAAEFVRASSGAAAHSRFTLSRL